MSDHNKTILSKQEKNWIAEQRITRLTDNKEVLIYPMGAERFLSSVLFGNKKGRYNIRADIEGKDVLVIPGYGNSGFLFAQAGAKSVTVYDKDPVTIAWIKAFKKYYNYREYNEQGKPFLSIGELLVALTQWYPPLITLPSGAYINTLLWALHPKSLRRTYIYYMLSLVQNAIKSKVQDEYELNKNIQFYAGEINQLIKTKEQPIFDTAFVPYLLGVKNGIEKTEDIVYFITQLTKLVPQGSIVVSPSRDMKELYFMGQRYFVTTGYPNMNTIPGLKTYIRVEDRDWFKTQGLAVFGVPQP